MQIGIFAKTFTRPTLEETLNAVVAHRVNCVQFNFACAGLPSMPDRIPPGLATRVREELQRRSISMAAVSGTFNMIDPDFAKRKDGLRRLAEIAAHCAEMGTSLVTLCTGSRDPQNMWKHHPANDSKDAWHDLIASMDVALEIAEKFNITLGVEPECANIISSADKARRLLDVMKSPRLKIVMDASNLFHPRDWPRMEEILNHAFDLLGRDIILAHAKDFRDSKEGFEFMAPGKGILEWDHYLWLLRKSGYAGPLIMHSLAESEVEDSLDFLLEKQRESGQEYAATFIHDGIHFHYRSRGKGTSFFFQHGLGADVMQPFGLFEPPRGVQMLAFDCRAHGQTRPVGPDEKISFGSFADDLLALMDYLEIQTAVIGGISMGAAIAMNFALRFPERTRGLILHRPAWLDGPRRDNVEVYATIARLIREKGAEQGLEIFKKTALYQKVLAISPDSAKSLLSHFLHTRAAETVIKLEKIPLDAPNFDKADWKKIHVPTLVLANRQDTVHPFEYGEILAREIPGAQFGELTPKSVSVERYREDTQRFIENFLKTQTL